MGVKHELQNIISGIGHHAEKNLIQTAANHIGKSKKTSGNAEEQQFTKEQETEELIKWIAQESLWFNGHDESRFIANGAEQRVYLYSDEVFVYKLNDSIFYKYWLDYFHSLLIHNYFFPSTAYELIGFYQKDEILFAVVKQPFIAITENTDTEIVKLFLHENGFQLRKNNDYFNPEIGLILEDLHDENVLTNNGVLFFVDTVFYLEKKFFQP
ncbi:MAG: hypothetical protein FJX88_05735 [Bacteroidetes bacterium]|nr:hypothetical protein [Bacteroidota bacterium]